MEKAMATHSSTLAWRIPWTEEPGGLQSMGSLRVGHDWVTSLSLFTFTGEGNGSPLQCSCLENPRDGGAWWAAVYGIAQSRTWLKRLSSSSILFSSHEVLIPTSGKLVPYNRDIAKTSQTSLGVHSGHLQGRSQVFKHETQTIAGTVTATPSWYLGTCHQAVL